MSDKGCSSVLRWMMFTQRPDHEAEHKGQRSPVQSSKAARLAVHEDELPAERGGRLAHCRHGYHQQLPALQEGHQMTARPDGNGNQPCEQRSTADYGHASLHDRQGAGA